MFGYVCYDHTHYYLHFAAVYSSFLYKMKVRWCKFLHFLFLTALNYFNTFTVIDAPHCPHDSDKLKQNKTMLSIEGPWNAHGSWLRGFESPDLSLQRAFCLILQKEHLNHHFKNGMHHYGFGVTSSFWDTVFGTLPPAKDTHKGSMITSQTVMESISPTTKVHSTTLMRKKESGRD